MYAHIYPNLLEGQDLCISILRSDQSLMNWSVSITVFPLLSLRSSYFFVVANDLVILCNKDPSFFFEGSLYILYITSNGIVNILKTSLPQQFFGKGWYLSYIWEIFILFCNFISIYQVRKELILHGQPFLCKQLKYIQMWLLYLAFPALGLFLQWDSKFSRDEFYCFLQIPCVMWILKLKTLCVSIYVHGYECVESYAHVYVEAGFKFKYCFSSGASHCFFLSPFEKGWWTTMGLKHIEDSGKRGMESKNHFKLQWGIWWFFIQEIKRFHSCNMNIFFLTITYFLISFLYYFESCPWPTTRYLLRVRTNIIA